MSLTERVKSAFSSNDSQSESMSASDQFQQVALGSLSLRNSEFISDIYNEDLLTPHEEMRGGYRMLHNDPKVASAVGTRTDVIMGDDLSVDTEDDETRKFFEQEVLPKLRTPIRNAVRDMSITGNGYIEVLRGQDTGIPMDFEEMERPHKIWIDFEDGTFNIDRYIIQTRGTKSGNHHDVRYYDGRRRTVKGKPIPKENIIHLREGSSVIPKYGRSDFLSALDAYKIKRELLRSQAVILRQKSIPRKLIKVESSDGEDGVNTPGNSAGPKQKQQIENKLSNMGDYENPVFYNTDIEVEDFDYDPSKSENQDVLKELGKEITASMPNFYTNPEDSNRATAKEEKQLLELRMKTVRSNIKTAINPILKEIADQNGYATDVSLEFGDYSFPTREEKIENAQTLFDNDVITRNEARSMLGLDKVDDGDDGFKSDLADSGDGVFEDAGDSESSEE